MRNKGFSLIEIAAVLVIIGVIFLMVVKGSQLLGASNIRVELSKVNTISIGVNNFYERFERLPGDIGNKYGIISLRNNPDAYDELIASGFLNKGDFIPSMEKLSLPATATWRFIRCIPTEKGYITVKDQEIDRRTNVRGNLCIGLNKTEDLDDKPTPASFDDITTYRVRNSYELLFDDSDLRSGLGRGEDPADVVSVEELKKEQKNDEFVRQNYFIKIW